MRQYIFFGFNFYSGRTALDQVYIKRRMQLNAFNVAKLFAFGCQLAISFYPVAMKEAGT
jgi:hypothetical protein